jgi:hypothetical protein
MPNLLAKLTALGMIGGGFAATGDLGWIAERGMRVLDAADVAGPTDPAEPMPTPGVARNVAEASPPIAPSEAARPAAPGPGAPVAPAPPLPAARAVMKPPTGGPTEVAWSGIAAGDRVVVWLATGGTRCLVLDIVDPATGEALAYDAAAVSPEGRPMTAAGPPRRVVVGRQAGERGLAVGGMLNLASAGIATHGQSGRWLGPIEALTLVD